MPGTFVTLKPKNIFLCVGCGVVRLLKNRDIFLWVLSKAHHLWSVKFYLYKAFLYGDFNIDLCVCKADLVGTACTHHVESSVSCFKLR